MAATLITATSVPQSVTGLNITDATYSTLTSGGSNGVKFTAPASGLVLLKNDTGGSAVFTVNMSTPTSISAYSGSVTSPTITVATGKTYLLRLSEIFKDSSGQITITCDVAGKVIVLDL